ncbi:glycosyltransferase [Chitinophagaceae bacterium IBVUCB1]|nr:glycosyltransferase [Chitinophagaceae bacterium IBVUCB1]
MSDTRTRFKELNACVLIPTYNNAGTLADVLHKVLEYTDDLIVVNDGSTDNTADILQQFPQIHAVNYTPNRGKGIALRTGIKKAAELGYRYAITMDSDGQHYASDLPLFLDAITTQPDALIIGARNLNQENVQLKSSFGNKFSNFWFWVNTGTKLPDTQSGYRLYPVRQLAHKTYFTRKYEFEIEVIVRASWGGVPATYIPISVYYPKPEERVSHFRPFKDFTRISILNTVLVLIALLWIKPRDFFRLLLKKEGIKTIWKTIFVHPQESNHTKAASVAFGVFMGIVPVWGFQLAIGIPAAILLRLNKALFIIAANISIFPLTPFVWMASLITGKWIMGNKEWIVAWRDFTLQRFMQEGLAFFLGGTVLSIAAGIVAYVLTYLCLLLFRGRR